MCLPYVSSFQNGTRGLSIMGTWHFMNKNVRVGITKYFCTIKHFLGPLGGQSGLKMGPDVDNTNIQGASGNFQNFHLFQNGIKNGINS